MKNFKDNKTIKLVTILAGKLKKKFNTPQKV